MAVWTEPLASDDYADWPSLLQARADSQAKMFDDGVTWTSLPTNTIRWNSSNDRFEKWNGSVWGNLSAALTAVCKTANNLSDLASASTARTNLGLGTIAVLNSPLGLANGGTGGTDAATARTGLGLGSIATQAASLVTITGGSLSGISSLIMNSLSTLSMTSTGTISNVSTITNTAAIGLTTTGGAFALDFRTNNVLRFSITTAAIIPGADNTYDIGASGATIKDLYAGRLISSLMYSASDIAFQISGTTYWVMGSASKEFRPNTNATQNLGHASYRWATFYVDSINGAQTSIHMSDSSDVHIRYLTNTGGDHRFYTGLGSSEVFKIESTGKLNPVVVGRPDYTISYGWTVRRTITGAETVAQAMDAISTLIADLVAVGLFQ